MSSSIGEAEQQIENPSSDARHKALELSLEEEREYEDYEESEEVFEEELGTGCEMEEPIEEQIRKLEAFSFPEAEDKDDDHTGKLAYKHKAKEFQMMFPITSVVDKLPREDGSHHGHPEKAPSVLPGPGKLLEHHKTFTTSLSLPHFALGDKGAISLAEAIKVNVLVRTINLRDNNITCTGGAEILEAIGVNASVTYVDVSGNKLGLGRSKGRSIGEVFKAVFPKCKNITELCLRGNRIGDKDGALIAESVLADNSTLMKLDMSYNELGPKSGAAFGEMIWQFGNTLKELNLGWNYLRTDGLRAFLRGLRENNVMKRVNLSWNGVGDLEAKLLGEITAKNTVMEHFDLSHNRIGSAGAVFIAAGIKDNAGLSYLSLAHNPLKDSGVKAVIAALRDNPTLQTIDLLSTQAGREAKKELQDAFRIKGFKKRILFPLHVDEEETARKDDLG